MVGLALALASAKVLKTRTRTLDHSQVNTSLFYFIPFFLERLCFQDYSQYKLFVSSFS
jgi:hypothetical protein